jgi:uncharacterized membrane protein
MAPWDWISLLPAHEQPRRRQRRHVQRLCSQLRRPRTAIALLLLLYLSLVLVLALKAGAVLALLAAMPLLLAPLLSALIYWLLWSEFHR